MLCPFVFYEKETNEDEIKHVEPPLKRKISILQIVETHQGITVCKPSTLVGQQLIYWMVIDECRTPSGEFPIVRPCICTYVPFVLRQSEDTFVRSIVVVLKREMLRGKTVVVKKL